jgi:hypothetical protein
MDHRSFDFAHEAKFGNLKTKGFNLAETHLTNADKLPTHLAELGLAVALAVKTGVAAALRWRRPRPRYLAFPDGQRRGRAEGKRLRGRFATEADLHRALDETEAALVTAVLRRA